MYVHVMICKMFEIALNTRQEVKVSDAKELAATVRVLELWMHVHSSYIHV